MELDVLRYFWSTLLSKYEYVHNSQPRSRIDKTAALNTDTFVESLMSRSFQTKLQSTKSCIGCANASPPLVTVVK